MSEMVERVAKAVAMCEGARMALRRNGETLTVAAMAGYAWKPDDPAHERYANDHWREYVNHATFAVEAMREPTQAMLTVFADGDDPAYREDWQTMIDEALK